jgi:hypothetical protein
MILFVHSTSICVEQIDIHVYPPQKQTKSNIKQNKKKQQEQLKIH